MMSLICVLLAVVLAHVCVAQTNIVSNNNFASGFTNWTASNTTCVTNVAGGFPDDPSTTQAQWSCNFAETLSQTLTTTAGAQYFLSYDVSGTVTVTFGGVAVTPSTVHDAADTARVGAIVTATTASTALVFSATSGNVDNVYVVARLLAASTTDATTNARYIINGAGVQVTLSVTDCKQVGDYSIDVNGQNGASLAITSPCAFPSVTLTDSSANGAPTPFVLTSGANTDITSLVLNNLAGITFQGHFNSTGGSTISGTLRGNLAFNANSAYTSTGNIQLQLTSGNVQLISSQLSVGSFLVVASQADATVTCSSSVISTSSSSSFSAGGVTWSGVSVGFATPSTSNTVGVTHLNFTGCTFNGSASLGRGYFNYYNRQNVLPGNTYITNSNFNFPGKLRIRASNNAAYSVSIINSIVTSAGSDVAFGNPASGTPTGSVLVQASNVTASNGSFETYGLGVNFAGSIVYATQGVTISLVS